MKKNLPQYLLQFTLLTACQSCYSIETLKLTRADGNTTPALLYAPAGACAGTAILSHGAGGSENGLAYMAKFLQSKNWNVIVLGHVESGQQVLRSKITGLDFKAGLADLLVDSNSYRARFDDIAAAKLWSTSRCNNSFAALIGHSMGAATTLLLAGANNSIGLKTQIRFDAYIAMSAQGVGKLFPANAWSPITAPVYVLTGTKDQAHNGDWKTRLAVYESMPAGCKWQGIVDGANHKAFGRGGSDSEASLITGSVLAFLNAVKAKNCLNTASKIGMSIDSK